jgi:hypothetical protein
VLVPIRRLAPPVSTKKLGTWLEHLTDEELEDIEGKNEGRAKAVLEARKASEEAKHKLRLIDRDA